MTHTLRHGVCAGAVMLLLVVASFRVAAQYNVVDLGASGGEAAGINNAGQIVGWAYNTYWEEDFAVFWTNSSSPLVYLTTGAADYYSEAASVNSSGQIAGGEQLGENTGYAYEGAFWNDSSSTAAELFSFVWGAAYSINDSGQIVGFAGTAEDQDHAALWYSYSSVPFIDLGTLGGKTSAAYGINNSGQIVGNADTAAEAQHAAYWTNYTSVAVDLGTLGYPVSQANSINGAGQIVGYAGTMPLEGVVDPNAVYWTNSSSMPLLLNTLGGSTSEADTINSSGQIVGYCETSGGVDYAVLWVNSSSAPLDLNMVIPGNSGWVLNQATAINDSGEIVGYGKNPQGNTDAFALIPAPVLYVSVGIPNTVLVWWVPVSSNYTLQTNGNLGTGTWAAYGGTIVNNNGTNSVTMTSPSGNLFFRLSQP